MKDKIVIDLGKIMDDVFQAAQELGDAVQEGLHKTTKKGEEFFARDSEVDYYPAYSYPPANVYMSEDQELVFEFALAGFDKKDISLKFLGDYLLLNAAVDERFGEKESFKYFKHRLKLKNITDQKYFAPADKFDQEKTQAEFINGVLRAVIPPRETPAGKSSFTVEVK